MEKDKSIKGLWQQMQEAPKQVYNAKPITLQELLDSMYELSNQQRKQANREQNLILDEKAYKWAKENPKEFQKAWREMVIKVCEEGGLI